MNLRKSLQQVIAATLATLLLVGCAPRGIPAELDPDWLVSEADISVLSDMIGIVDWELEEEQLGEFRLCRIFTGTSWSINRNFAQNCVHRVAPDTTFDDVIEFLFDQELLLPSDIELESSLDYESFALYAHFADNGHAVYDAILYAHGLLLRASVSLATQPGVTPESLYERGKEVIEAFLGGIFTLNLERIRGSQVEKRRSDIRDGPMCPSRSWRRITFDEIHGSTPPRGRRPADCRLAV